jgi:phage-related tail fiber protein
MSNYFALLTQVGEAKLANAVSMGGSLKLTHMAVGDGNGATPAPDRLQKALVREVRRAALNQLIKDEANPGQIIAEQVLPEDVGGWWVREIGLYDDAGDLCAVANCPPSYKPKLAEGSGREQVIRIVLVVSSTSAVELRIDPTIVMATRRYVDEAITVYAAPKEHMHADLAPLKSPLFTDVPKAPTAAAEANTDQIATTKFVKTAVASAIATAMLFASAVPATKLTDALYVKDLGPVEWVEVAGTGAFSGYRSPECGRLLTGTTSAPRAYELDLIGGIVNKTSYASLWAWAQQEGHVVTAATWAAKTFKFADIDATTFRLPDLRDIFVRFTGTIAGSSTPRALGSFLDDAMQGHWHLNGVNSMKQYQTGGTINDFLTPGTFTSTTSGVKSPVTDGVNGTPRTASETRPMSTAFAPRIHI